MKVSEMLAAAAAAQSAWATRYADDVPWDATDAGAAPDDYPEHHADISASPKIDDILNQQLADLIERTRA